MFPPVSSSIPEFSYTYSGNVLELNQPLEDLSQLLHLPTLTYLGEGEEMHMAQWLSQLKQDRVVSSNDCLEVSERATIVAERVNALAEEQKQKQPLVSKSTDNNTKKSNNKRPRKRTGKKDRHSKICTAQGPRDRRMRLSLQIARRFFDLQDMLGFDKASKTIEWLLVKSRSAIKELLTKNEQFTKRCKNDPNIKPPMLDSCSQELMMEIDEQPNIVPEHRKKNERKKPHKAVPVVLAKESRNKARARARERTRGKMKTEVLQGSPSNLEQETCENNMESRNQEMTSSHMAVAELAEAESQVDLVSTIGNFSRFVGSPPRFLSSSTTSSVAALDGMSSKDALSGLSGKCEVERAGSWSDYNAMTIMKDLATGNALLENHDDVPLVISQYASFSAQGYHFGSEFMTNSVVPRQSPSSFVMNISSTSDEIPNSILKDR